MEILRFTLAALIVCFTLFAGTSAEAVEENISKNSIKLSESKNAEDYVGKLDQLLTLEMAAKVTGFEPSQAKMKYGSAFPRVKKGKSSHPRSCDYYWESNRVKEVTIGDRAHKIPQKDRVGINWVSNTTLEVFQRNYRPMTAQQKNTAAEKLHNEFNEGQKNNRNPQRIKGVVSAAQGLVKELSVEEVQEVGNAAFWYKNSNELKVFYNGLTFALVVDVSDDVDVNKDKAIELANIIVEEKL